MNAPQTATELSKPTISMLALTELVPSNTHIQELRRARFDPKLIGELAESIKGVGVLQAILVRPLPAGDGSKALQKLGRNVHQIVAGERRFLAAKKAGLTEIPASVRELTDEQVLEVQLIENLQREDLHELEEAEGYEELMKLKKISADAVGDMVGRSKGYVYARVKLLALSPEGRKSFYAGTLNASEALLIARIPHHDLQAKAMKELVEQKTYGDIQNYKDAARFIHDNYMLQLKAAPFKLDDVNLVAKAGPCTTCPKRTGNQKDLFGDVKSGDVCTDPKCFGEKRAAGEAKLIAEHKAKGVEVIVGEAAKRIFPYQDSYASNGYHLANEKCWNDSKGRKYGELVDKAEVKLVVSPKNGELIKVVHSSALPTVKAKKKQKAAVREKAKLGVDQDAINTRVLAAVHEKFSGELSKPFMQQILLEALIAAENVYGEGLDRIEKLWGLKAGSLTSGYDKLPKACEGFDAKKLAKLAIEILVGNDLDENDGRRSGSILDALKIDRKKIEKDLTAEAKTKAAEKPKAKAAGKK